MDTLLTKIDSQFVDGFWAAFFASAAIAVLAFALIKIAGKALGKLSSNGRFSTVNVSYTRRVMNAVIILLAVMLVFMQVKPLQSVSRSLLASSGVLAVILGFAAQQAMANVVGGFFISVFKPFVLGDRVRLADQGIEGFVEDISLRHTVIRTFENTRVIVPNSVMNAAVIENAQFQDTKVCRFLDIGISYDSDIDCAMVVVADLVRGHKHFYDNRTDEEKASGASDVIVRVTALGESAVNLRVAVWARDAGTAYEMLCDLRYAIKKRFDAEGIEIPYPHRKVIVQHSNQPS